MKKLSNLLLIVLISLPALLMGQDILVFSKTNGYRHESIPAGQAALKQIATDHHWNIHFTEDSLVFNKKQLKPYELIIFLHTSGDVLDLNQQRSFERFIKNGGAFVGIHCASATEYDWPWYGQLVGNVFDNHPKKQNAEVYTATEHKINEGLPSSWSVYDEWYNFRNSFNSSVQVLLTVDEKTYTGGKHGDYHPIAWCQQLKNSRSFYTALGHTEEAFSDSTYLRHLTQGIVWALDN